MISKTRHEQLYSEALYGALPSVVIRNSKLSGTGPENVTYAYSCRCCEQTGCGVPVLKAKGDVPVIKRLPIWISPIPTG